ncbi:insulinase family protein [Chryseobacterium sp. Tr-659]|nr:insulinase family protein [Chryseobacterium sp. Tr-659]
MKKRLFSWAALILAVTHFFGQSLPVDPAVKIGTLSNGMKYYIRKNTTPEKKVDFRLAINVGSILEDENQKGLAHFMEHMNFNGTKNFPDNKLIDFLQSIGIKFGQHINASTGFDRTVYMLPVPLNNPENLDIGLKVMEDWAFNATLSDEQINKERGVVLEEIRNKLGAGKRMEDKYLPKLLYNSHYLKRNIGGGNESITNFKPEALRKFKEEWYRPDLMALIVVGDINVDEVEKKIKDNFSKYKNPPNPRERKIFSLPNHKETLVAIETDPDATSSTVHFVIKDSEPYKPDATVEQYDQSIIENLSMIMLNHRLSELINSNDPPFISGSVYYGDNYVKDKKAFQGGAQTKDGNQLVALKALLEEVERAKRFGFTQQELDDAKANMLSGAEITYNNRDKIESDAWVGEYVNNFLEQEPIPGIIWGYENVKSFIPKITLTQTNEVIGKMMKDENRVIILTGPEKANTKKITESEVLETINAVKLANLKPYEKNGAIKNLVKPFVSEGKIVKTENDVKLGTTTWTLSNGAKVTFKKTNFKDDEIVFNAVSLGGTSLISDEDYLKTQFAFPGLLQAGLNGLSINDLNNYGAGRNASASFYVNELSEGISGNSSKKDLDLAMEFIYAIFTGMNFDEKAFNAYKEKAITASANYESNPQYYFFNEHLKFLNQKNPRFTNAKASKKDWENVDYKKLYSIFKAKFANAGNFHFYFVGNIEENELRKEVLQYIASLPSTGKTATFKDDGYRQVVGDYTKVYKKGKDPKSLVTITYTTLAPYIEKDVLALSALGEIASIKMTEKLREDESGIYSGEAKGYAGKVPFSYYKFYFNFPCGPENAEKLTKSAIAEIQKLIDNGPEQKDLDKYKEGEYNDYDTGLKNNSVWLNELTRNQLEGSDKYDILNYRDQVKALTVKDLQGVAKKYLTKGRIIAMLMPEDGWEKAGK